MNKKEIMKMAWAYRKLCAIQLKVKVSDVSMSECLKQVWWQTKNSEITYNNKTIAYVNFVYFNICIVTLVDENDTEVKAETIEYTDFQKVKIEVVKEYKKLVLHDTKMKRIDAYKDFLSKKGLTLDVIQDFKLKTTTLRIKSRQVEMKYKDYKNWFDSDTFEKFTECKTGVEILKKIGFDRIESISNTYNANTKTIKVAGVYEINSLESTYYDELIDYNNVVIDLLGTIYNYTNRQFLYCSDNVIRRYRNSYIVFMLNLNKSDIEKYTEYVENRKTTSFFKDNNYSFDYIKTAYAILKLERINKELEFMLKY